MSPKHTGNGIQFIFRLLPIIGLLCLIAGMGWACYKVTFDTAAIALMGLGVLFFLSLFIKVELANVKFYLHIILYTAIVLGICVVAYMFARQHTRKLDLTRDSFYSLSDQSTKYMKRLGKDVTVTIFDISPDPYREVMDMYKAVTGKVTWKVFNERTQPMEAAKFGEGVRNQDIFVTCGKNQKRLSYGEVRQNFENALTNAIIEVTRDKRIKLYFTVGHGELAYEQPEQPADRNEKKRAPSLAAFKNFIGERAIDTAALDLATAGFVPEDATVVIVAGARADLSPSEVAALESYLNKGGHLLALLDVALKGTPPKMDNFGGMLKTFGVDISDKIILDEISAQISGNLVQVSSMWLNKTQPITRDLAGRSTRLNQIVSHPITVGQAPEGVNVTELMKTSERSWAEDVPSLITRGRPDPPPLSQRKAQTLGVAAAKTAGPTRPGRPAPEDKGGARLVVYGSSQLIQDEFLAISEQAVQLMLNTINWLSEQEDQIAVPPRQIKGTPIILDNAQLRLIFFISVALIPAGLFFGGVSYSMLRRRR